MWDSGVTDRQSGQTGGQAVQCLSVFQRACRTAEKHRKHTEELLRTSLSDHVCFHLGETVNVRVYNAQSEEEEAAVS